MPLSVVLYGQAPNEVAVSEMQNHVQEEWSLCQDEPVREDAHGR